MYVKYFVTNKQECIASRGNTYLFYFIYFKYPSLFYVLSKKYKCIYYKIYVGIGISYIYIPTYLN